ncbi:beta strand repeat-containing protein [Ideonella paludis]|uniref:beta strand repeat-containing protein n=1 Tax=Ideonella paludis TaxID=1233411 RepID=UPI003634AA41
MGASLSGLIQAGNFSLQGEAAPTGWNNSATGLRLVNGTQIAGTSASGSNLLKGSYAPTQYGSSSALLVGENSSATVTLGSASTLRIEGDSSAYSAYVNSGQVARGILTQGTVNTSGTVNWVGSSRSSDGILSSATLHHSGGALSFSGSTSPLGIATGFTSSGITLNGALNVADGSSVSMEGSYTGRATNAGAAHGLKLVGAITSSAGSPGTLSLTGTAAAIANSATNEVGLSVGALSGWGDTRLLAQNPMGSSGAALITTGAIDVGSRGLQVLANGGQILQNGGTTWTAGQVTVDNSGAGRTSLIADASSSSAPISLGQAYGGSLAAGQAIALGSGLSLGNGVVLAGTVAASGTVDVAGASASGSAASNGLYASGTLSSSGGDIRLTGHNQVGAGVTLQGQVTASNSISINGSSHSAISTSQGVVIQGAVQALTGDLSLVGSTNSAVQRAVAITNNGAVNGSLALAGNARHLLIQADTLFINNGASVNAGASGTVSLETLSGNAVELGSADTLSANPASRVLGLDQSELNRITAAQLVVGQASGGPIKVASAVASADSSGHLTLRSGGAIEVASDLTVGSTGGKHLSLESLAGAGSISAAGVIRADQLRLIATDATAALASTPHLVNTLSAQVKSLDFRNGQALTVGTALGAEGITARDGVKVVTTSGDLFLDKAVTNILSGQVVLGAGVASAAGDGSGGDIKTQAGAAVSNGGRAVRLYTGSTVGTGNLGMVSSALDTLFYAGSSQAHNAAFLRSEGDSIASGPPIQVLFRQANAPTVTGALNGVALERPYNGLTLQANADLSTLHAALKAAPGNSGHFSVAVGANDFGIAKADVIDQLALDASTQALRNVKRGGQQAPEAYALGWDTSLLPALGFAFTAQGAPSSTLMLTPKAASITGIATTLTYNGQSQSQQPAQLSGFLQADLNAGTVAATGLATGRNAGSYSSNLAVTGADAQNYAVTVHNADLVIAKKAASITGVATTLTYNGQSQTQSEAVLSGFVAADVNAGTVAATGLASGRNAGSYSSNLAVTGADAQNYAVTVNNADLVIAKKAATITGVATTLTYNGQSQTQSEAVLSGFVAADVNAGTVAATGLASGRNAGSYSSNLGATGADAQNYAVTVNNADLVIAKRPPASPVWPPR